LCPLADTHCHLDFASFSEDRLEVLERAWEAGLTHILNPGIDLSSSLAAVQLAETHPGLFAAVGVHPNDARTWDETTLERLAGLARHPKVVAIGEIGLDYYRDRAPAGLQQEVFLAQLNLAERVGLPVIIHSRQAIQDTLRLLGEWHARLVTNGSPLKERPGVLHSFEGTLQDALIAARYNFIVGIGGPVTFRNAAQKHDLVSGLPINQLVLETDAPFLTPHPYRGRRNEPAHVRLVAEAVAALQNQPFSTVAEVTSENAARLFAWSL